MNKIRRITCRDIMLDDLDDLMQGNKADCMYVDPPWGQGNLTYWHTMNNIKKAPKWEDFLKRLKYIFERHCKGIAYIETGIRFLYDVIGVFGNPFETYTVYYKSGNKKYQNLICIYGRYLEIDITNKTGKDLVKSCLQFHKGGSVLDPCAGLGTTAKVAKMLDMDIYCNEFNYNRAIRTSKILEREIWK